MPLPGGPNVDPYPNLLTRVGRHLSLIFLTVIFVRHSIAINSLFALFRVTGLTAIDRWGVSLVHVTSSLTADGGPDETASNGCCVIVMTATNLMSDNTTNDRAQEGPAGFMAGMTIKSLVLHFFLALSYRCSYHHVIDDRLTGYHVGIMARRCVGGCGPQKQRCGGKSCAFRFSNYCPILFCGHLINRLIKTHVLAPFGQDVGNCNEPSLKGYRTQPTRRLAARQNLFSASIVKSFKRFPELLISRSISRKRRSNL